jgi:hypothetical protein
MVHLVMSQLDGEGNGGQTAGETECELAKLGWSHEALAIVPHNSNVAQFKMT